MASGFYEIAMANLLLQGPQLFFGPIRVSLVTENYVPDFSAHRAFSEVSPYEVSSRGYRRCGKLLQGQRTVSTNPGAPLLMADDTYWPNSTITARGAVLYQSKHPQALLLYLDFGSNRISIGGVFQLAWSQHGIVALPDLCA